MKNVNFNQDINNNETDNKNQSSNSNSNFNHNENENSFSFLLPKSFQSFNLTRGNDTFDVWFDSGCMWKTISPSQSDIYIEGHDQFRGWFQSSLITWIASNSNFNPSHSQSLHHSLVQSTCNAPMKTIISHGFVIDSKGQKMSKSIGNIIEPERILQEGYKNGIDGVDLLRLWVAFSDYTCDVAISDQVIATLIDTIRRLRNTFKFLLGNLDQKDLNSFPSLFINETIENNKNQIENGNETMKEKRLIDDYALWKVKEFIKSSKGHYEKYEFHHGKKISSFPILISSNEKCL